ncbi:nickel-dependent hydrogenase large subunit [Rhodoblastus sp. 17X3]|uniref:nickel-dependent hydrogenase large subunit n=1 Tax=Rhodoblastus sp. 17X3 TaxID=3047026 RepID=UPI0024B785A9|nr:nickel-dependent hydrogenase large subunit [Rhodoblastus sp. 17X3]MDI9849700.1 nickel-dependent hydrogenase large subunit [Rhodoblastus sp. 17X3]
MSAVPANLLLRAKLRGGFVADIDIVSPRADPSPVFIGLAPAEAATIAGRLFSLCPMAQSLAAQAAGEAAFGFEAGASQRRERALKLLCERLGEMLRASLLDWPGDAPPAPQDISRLRLALKALRDFPQTDGALERIDALAAALLGLDDMFVRQQAEVLADESNWELAALGPDCLGAADDAAVFEAMTRDTVFSRAPALPGRCAETGAAARQQAPGGGLASRLAARRVDMAATLDGIRALLAGGAAPDGLLGAQGDASGWGFAAVDSARGRLYHALRLDSAGRIADYRIVAPTEWNFHPEGPFARLLRGARIGAGAAAKRRIERLAFVFDPCIRACAEVLDEDDA